MIDFWASWCNPCRKEIPNLKKLYALDAEVLYARRDDLGLSRVDENPHERGGKGADQHADDDAEHRACQPGTADPFLMRSGWLAP